MFASLILHKGAYFACCTGGDENELLLLLFLLSLDSMQIDWDCLAF